MKFFEILSQLNPMEQKGDFDIEVSGIQYDSRAVKPGDVFVCIRGYKVDGHRFAPSAVEKGASVLIVEEFIDSLNVPQVLVKDARSALAKASAVFYSYSSSKMKLVGITATNGKTTTSFMADKILTDYGYETGLIGTVAVRYSDVLIPSELTTPESMDLQRHFFNMSKAGVTHVTMEVSSSALDLKRVDYTDYDIVSLANVSRDHIDLHGSFDDYFNSKARLIREAKESAWVILNMDCPYSSSLIGQTKAHVVTFSVEKDADIICRNLDLSTGRARFTLQINKDIAGNGVSIQKGSFEIELGVPGYHSVINSMVAIIIGLLSNVPKESIQKSLKSFVGVERRFEFVYEGDFKIIDDHFANSGNIDVTLGTLKFMKFGKLKMVYAVRGSRGVVVNSENAHTMVKWFRQLGINEVIATLSRSHTTEKDYVTDQELEAFMTIMKDADIKVRLYEELPEAIAVALAEVEKDDLLMLAGCQGMDPGAHIALGQIHKLHPEYDAEKLFEPLKDRVVAQELLEEIMR